jgi:hypothetical protein
MMEFSEGTVLLFGTRGFSLGGFVDTDTGIYLPPLICPCAPGTLIEVTAASGGPDFGAVFTLDGQTYQSDIATGTSAQIEVTGPAVIAPPLRPRRATVMTTFDLGGALFYDPDLSDPDSVSEGFGGRGKVTLFLEREGDAWVVPRARYQIQSEVVPEPGTMLLLGTGLAALAARARRRRRRT